MKYILPYTFGHIDVYNLSKFTFIFLPLLEIVLYIRIIYNHHWDRDTRLELTQSNFIDYRSDCGGTGTDSTVQVPITTGTVTDSGSEYTSFIGVISGYIYKTGKL